MMKSHHTVFCAMALAAFVLSGCAATNETVTTTQAQTDPAKRVHTQEELRKTGQSETGPALERTDAAVQTSGPR
jgi:outer membrane biogenesis lipoprotein LolB